MGLVALEIRFELACYPCSLALKSRPALQVRFSKGTRIKFLAGPVGPATILVLELVPKFDGVRISKGSNPSLASSYATRLGGEDTETRDRDIV